MDFVENVGVSSKRAEAGFGAKIDRPVAIFNPRKIGGIGVAEFSSAEGDETGVFWGTCKVCRHLKQSGLLTRPTLALLR